MLFFHVLVGVFPLWVGLAAAADLILEEDHRRWRNRLLLFPALLFALGVLFISRGVCVDMARDTEPSKAAMQQVD